jgi:hypothetical protein
MIDPAIEASGLGCSAAGPLWQSHVKAEGKEQKPFQV